MKKIVLYLLFIPLLAQSEEITFQCNTDFADGQGRYKNPSETELEYFYRYDDEKEVLYETNAQIHFACSKNNWVMSCTKMHKINNESVFDLIKIGRKDLNYNFKRVIDDENNNRLPDFMEWKGKCRIIENQF